MLRNAAEHWDSTRHVFRFNQCELCPMIEEFTTLMNRNDFKFVLLPLKPNKAIELLNECLGIPYSLGRTWIKEEISLKTLVEYFREKENHEYYLYALLIAILAGFFLVGDFESMDPKIVEITSMLSTDNLVPVILAKTLSGLYYLKDSVYDHFLGSLMLLQVTSCLLAL